MTRPRLIRPGFFAWLAIPALGWFALQMVGLPHMIWSYDWSGRGGYGDVPRRHYTRCSYVGFHGTITEHPTDGACDWVRFAKAAGGR